MAAAANARLAAAMMYMEIFMVRRVPQAVKEMNGCDPVTVRGDDQNRTVTMGVIGCREPVN